MTPWTGIFKILHTSRRVTITSPVGRWKVLYLLSHLSTNIIIITVWAYILNHLPTKWNPRTTNTSNSSGRNSWYKLMVAGQCSLEVNGPNQPASNKPIHYFHVLMSYSTLWVQPYPQPNPKILNLSLTSSLPNARVDLPCAHAKTIAHAPFYRRTC